MTLWLPDRQHRGRSGRFTSKVDAFSRARHVYVCQQCSAWHPAKRKACDSQFSSSGQVCGGKLLCMDSKAEAKRYAELRLMERYNDIGALEVHPRFPCTVNGVLVCTYIADFAYVDRSGRVIEDVKGNKDFTDSASALRRKFAEALHGFQVRIVEA